MWLEQGGSCSSHRYMLSVLAIVRVVYRGPGRGWITYQHYVLSILKVGQQSSATEYIRQLWVQPHHAPQSPIVLYDPCRPARLDWFLIIFTVLYHALESPGYSGGRMHAPTDGYKKISYIIELVLLGNNRYSESSMRRTGQVLLSCGHNF